MPEHVKNPCVKLRVDAYEARARICKLNISLSIYSYLQSENNRASRAATKFKKLVKTHLNSACILK